MINHDILIERTEYNNLKNKEQELNELKLKLQLIIGKNPSIDNINKFHQDIIQYSLNNWYCDHCGHNLKQTGHKLNCLLLKKLAFQLSMKTIKATNL